MREAAEEEAALAAAAAQAAADKAAADQAAADQVPQVEFVPVTHLTAGRDAQPPRVRSTALMPALSITGGCRGCCCWGSRRGRRNNGVNSGVER